MSKATEEAMDQLHGDVAKAYSELINDRQEVYEPDAEGEMVATGKKMPTATPALLAGAVKMLNDNKVTLSRMQNDAGQSVDDMLKNRTKHSDKSKGKTGNMDAIKAALEAYDSDAMQ